MMNSVDGMDGSEGSVGQISAVSYVVDGAFSAVSYSVETDGVGVRGGSSAVW